MSTPRKSGAPRSVPLGTDTVRTAAASHLPQDAVKATRSKLQIRGTGAGKDDQSWVQELAVYDKHGPLVGAYCDWVAADVKALMPIVKVSSLDTGWKPLERLDREEAWINNVRAASAQVLERWKSRSKTSAEIRHDHARFILSGGIAWIYESPTEGICIVNRHEVQLSTDKATWTWKRASRPDVVVSMPSDRLWRSWTPDPIHPDAPYTELVRAIPHVREFISAKRRQQSDARSAQLNGLTWFDDEFTRFVRNDGSVISELSDDENESGVPEVIRDYANLAIKENDRPYHEKRPATDMVPSPMYGGEKPELVSLTRDIDPAAFELETKSIEAFARSLLAPTKLIVEGPGNAKYDNEGLLYQAWLRGPIQKYASIVFADWTRMWYVPNLTAVLDAMGVSGSLPLGFQAKLDFDVDTLMPRQDNFKNYVDAVRWGGMAAHVLADKLGEEAIERPADISDFGMWEIAIGLGTGDPGLGVDRKINDSDGKGSTNVESGTGDRATNAATAAVSPPKALPAAALPPLVELTLPPSVLQFATEDVPRGTSEAEALIRSIENLESRTWMAVELTLSAAILETIRLTKREFGRRIPSTPRGRELRKLSIAEVLATATPTELKEWGLDDLDAIVASVTDVSGLERALTNQEALINQTLDDDADKGLSVASAVAVALGAVALIVAGRLRKGGATADSDFAPNYLIAEIGLAFAGAQVSNGMVLRNVVDGSAYDLAGNPVSGMMLSSKIIGIIETLTGGTVRWQWAHSFYRVPIKPYPEHIALDGQFADSRWGIGGHRPQQDENGEWCTCALLPRLEL